MGLWLAIILVVLGGGLLLAGRLVAPQDSQGNDGAEGGARAKSNGKPVSRTSGKQAAFATPSILAAAAAAEMGGREKTAAPSPQAAPAPAPPATGRSSTSPDAAPAASGERPSSQETSKKIRAEVLVEKVKAEFDKILRESQSGRPASGE